MCEDLFSFLGIAAYPDGESGDLEKHWDRFFAQLARDLGERREEKVLQWLSLGGVESVGVVVLERKSVDGIAKLGGKIEKDGFLLALRRCVSRGSVGGANGTLVFSVHCSFPHRMPSEQLLDGNLLFLYIDALLHLLQHGVNL